jgi:hypothetical protein
VLLEQLEQLALRGLQVQQDQQVLLVHQALLQDLLVLQVQQVLAVQLEQRVPLVRLVHQVPLVLRELPDQQALTQRRCQQFFYLAVCRLLL